MLVSCGEIDYLMKKETPYKKYINKTPYHINIIRQFFECSVPIFKSILVVGTDGQITLEK